MEIYIHKEIPSGFRLPRRTSSQGSMVNGNGISIKPGRFRRVCQGLPR